jgi:hypothetical protein
MVCASPQHVIGVSSHCVAFPKHGMVSITHVVRSPNRMVRSAFSTIR